MGVNREYPVSISMLTGLLQWCTRNKELEVGRHVEFMIVQNDLQWSINLGFQLIRMFSSCECMPEALRVFKSLPEQNTHTWTAIISAHAQHGQGEKALTLYKEMQMSSVEPNSYTLVAALKACACIAALEQGKLVHSDLRKRGLGMDLFVGNTLIDMYSKCGSIEDARKVFNKLLVRNVVSWNAMIAGYNEHGHNREALLLFQKMQQEGIEPSLVTILCILKVCTSLVALDHGNLIHSEIYKRGFEQDLFVGSALVHMYSKCNMLEDARTIFDKCQVKTVVTWSAMISGYSENGHAEAALNLFQKMQQNGMKPDQVTFVCILKACAIIGALHEGKRIHADIIKCNLESNIFVGSILIDMYAKCYSLGDACKVFDNLPVRNAVSWSAMIEGYGEHGQGDKAIQLFEKMQQQGIEPSEVTFVCLLKSCASTAALDQGKLIHADIVKRGHESDTFIRNTFIDMYAKCGSLVDAHKVFDMLDVQSLVSWSAIIAGYANHGHFRLAHQCFERMHKEGVQPDSMTFASLLSACSHAGLVQEGHFYFKSMKVNYNITPTAEHYVCMVDLLGRAGLLDEAEDLVCKIPFEADSVVWKALLGACAKYGNFDIGRRAFDCFARLSGRNAAGYVLMSNIYAANNMWANAQRVQEMRVQLNACHTSWKSSVEVGKSIDRKGVG